MPLGAKNLIPACLFKHTSISASLASAVVMPSVSDTNGL
jgi:hypothetical protein